MSDETITIIRTVLLTISGFTLGWSITSLIENGESKKVPLIENPRLMVAISLITLIADTIFKNFQNN